MPVLFEAVLSACKHSYMDVTRYAYKYFHKHFHKETPCQTPTFPETTRSLLRSYVEVRMPYRNQSHFGSMPLLSSQGKRNARPRVMRA